MDNLYLKTFTINGERMKTNMLYDAWCKTNKFDNNNRFLEIWKILKSQGVKPNFSNYLFDNNIEDENYRIAQVIHINCSKYIINEYSINKKV